MSARRQSSSCCISIPTWITSSGSAPAGTGGRSGARGASRRPAAPRWSRTVRFTRCSSPPAPEGRQPGDLQSCFLCDVGVSLAVMCVCNG